MTRPRKQLLRELDAWQELTSRPLHRWAGVTIVRQFLSWVREEGLDAALGITEETAPLWGDHEFVPQTVQEWAARAWVALWKIREGDKEPNSVAHDFFEGRYGNVQVNRIRDPEAAIRDFWLLPIFLQLRVALDGPIAFHADVARWVQRVDAWGIDDLAQNKEKSYQDDLERWLFDQGWSLGNVGRETAVGNGRVDFLLQGEVRAVVELKLAKNVSGVVAQVAAYQERTDSAEIHVVVINTSKTKAMQAHIEPFQGGRGIVHLHVANPLIPPSRRAGSTLLRITAQGVVAEP